jgi:flavin-dependent dehydrogenase
MISQPEHVDVLVVGARCAGAATARLLARRGARVLVVDRGAHGADTLSTHALMRGAVVQLHRWGLLPALVAAGTPPIRTTTFDYAGDRLTVDISARHGVGALYAPRRTVLDRVLAEAAIAAGADVRYGQRLVSLDRDDQGRVRGASIEDARGQVRTVRAGVVVGADGRHSTVGRLTGTTRRRTGRAATATVYGHWTGLAVDGYRWMYALDASAGAIPTNDGAACVFVTVPAAMFAATFGGGVAAGFHRTLARVSPSLADAIASTAPLGGLHGFPGQPGVFMACQGPGWALVGDAAYFKDPLTAHGITDALLHAELLADAVDAGTAAALQAYESTRTTIATPVFDATEAIATFSWTLDQVRVHHTSLARAMAAEIDAALAAFREPAPDLAVPVLDDDQVGRGGFRAGFVDHEQELSPVR